MNQYPVMEHFYTIQGEGVYAGYAAYFIRLAGCDVGCTWCDVKESWHTEGYPKMSAQEMLKLVLDAGANRCVITGGEPTLYDLNPICDLFHENGITMHIETSGVNIIQGNFDWICLSPKKFKSPIKQEIDKAHELKVVIFNKSDFQWAEDWAPFCNENCVLLLQPEWEKREAMLPLIIDYVKSNPHWQISLQTHKYIHVP
jgi:organic radical activating enzyme